MNDGQQANLRPVQTGGGSEREQREVAEFGYLEAEVTTSLAIAVADLPEGGVAWAEEIAREIVASKVFSSPDDDGDDADDICDDLVELGEEGTNNVRPEWADETTATLVEGLLNCVGEADTSRGTSRMLGCCSSTPAQETTTGESRGAALECSLPHHRAGSAAVHHVGAHGRLPLVAMADSSAFFAKDSPLPPLIDLLTGPALSVGPRGCTLKGVYIGTANGDVDEYFEIALAAFGTMGLQRENCHFLRSIVMGGGSSGACALSIADAEKLKAAEVVILSGGNPAQAMAVWTAAPSSSSTLPSPSSSIAEMLRAKAEAADSLIIGVSAGGMQMSRWVWDSSAPANEEDANGSAGLALFRAGLGIAGAIPAFGMHEEAEGWAECKALLLLRPQLRCIVGVPFGGVALVDVERQTIRAMRRPLVLLSARVEPAMDDTVAVGCCWSFAHLSPLTSHLVTCVTPGIAIE